MPRTQLPDKQFVRGTQQREWRYGSQSLTGRDEGGYVVYRSYSTIVAVLVKASNHLHVTCETYSTTTTRHVRGLCLEHFGPSSVVSEAALRELVNA